MRQTFTLAPGASVRGANLPDGSPVYAIAIDNPSAAWLQLYPLGTAIAPLTVGYVVTIPGGSPAVDVLFDPSGPTGQPSVASGDTITVHLFDRDEAPAPSAGTPYVPLPQASSSASIISTTIRAEGATVAVAGPLLGVAIFDPRTMQVRKVRVVQAALIAAAANYALDLVRVTWTTNVLAAGLSIAALFGPSGAVGGIVATGAPGLVAGNYVERDIIRRYRIPLAAAQPVGPALVDDFDERMMYPPEGQGSATIASSQGFVLIGRGGLGTATLDMSIDVTTLGSSGLAPAGFGVR
jgi:hypothetical protein